MKFRCRLATAQDRCGSGDAAGGRVDSADHAGLAGGKVESGDLALRNRTEISESQEEPPEGVHTAVDLDQGAEVRVGRSDIRGQSRERIDLVEPRLDGQV